MSSDVHPQNMSSDVNPPKLPTALLAWGGTAALLILMLLLNPSADRHRAAIRADIDEGSPFERALGLGQFTAFMARYESLGFVSYTTLNDRVKSVGVLGMVFVRD